MSTYKGIKGFKVQSFAQDPVPSVAGWSSGSNMPLVLDNLGAAGTTSAVIAFGGSSPPLSPATQTTNIQYDGSSWTALTSMPQRRAQHSGFGLATAAIAASGEIISTGTTSVESWNGSSWTSTGAVSEQVNQSGGTGTQTAGFIAGGYNGPKAPAGTAQTQEYNGSTWSLGGNLPSGRYAAGAAGTQTAGVMFGGTPTLTAIVNYDGSSWTTSPVSISSRAYTQNSVHGNSSSDAAIIGGYDNSNAVVATDFWNGTAITTGASIATATLRGGSTTSGATTGMYKFGGGAVPGTSLQSTEEYNDYSEPNSFITVGQVFYNTTSKEFKYTGKVADSWATANNASTARYNMAGTGTQTAQMSCGGEPPPGGQVTNTEEYDGTDWSNGGALPVAKRASAAFGTQTSAVNASGLTTNPGTMFTTSEEYDGSSWTSGGAVNTGRNSHSASGILTAGLIFGGSTGPGNPGRSNATEEYDGTSFTAGGNLSTARSVLSGSPNGTQTASYATAGIGVPGFIAETEEYNGTSWSDGGDVNTVREQAVGGGTLTAGLLSGGNAPPGQLTATEKYDGTSWTTSSGTLNSARVLGTGGGSQDAGLFAFGTPGPGVATEEFTLGTLGKIETVTTS